MSSFATPNLTLNNIKITEVDVYEAFCSLDPFKASGSDGIGPNIIKLSLTSICGLLLYLFTQCRGQNTITSEWQIYNITPIHKSGERANILNS